MIRKKIILDVPYYHQLDPATGLSPKDRSNGCAIVCMKMVLEYCAQEQIDIVELYQMTEKLGGRNKKGDWTHAAQVRVLKGQGLIAWRRNWNMARADVAYFTNNEDYDSDQLSALERQNQTGAMVAILDSIKKGYPVIVSVKKYFQYEDKRHQVVIIGFDDDHLYINDPIAKDPANHPMKVTKDYFLEAFNYQAIFISR